MQKIFFIFIIFTSVVPLSALALSVSDFTPQGQVAGASTFVTDAHAAVVLDQNTGQTLLSYNADTAWVPASLTKLLTSLVVLDTQPDMNRSCTIGAADEVGGARLAARSGSVYKLRDLLSATLVASANNAANAMADCVGMSREQFVVAMNEKSLLIGATHSTFFEPSGMDPRNQTTALDMAHIANVAFSTPTIANAAAQQRVSFSSVSKPKKYHVLKTTNKLFGDAELGVVAGKTGYLDEAQYNFATSAKDARGNYIITVVLGSPTKRGSFASTKTLALAAFDQLKNRLIAAAN